MSSGGAVMSTTAADPVQEGSSPSDPDSHPLESRSASWGGLSWGHDLGPRPPHIQRRGVHLPFAWRRWCPHLRCFRLPQPRRPFLLRQGVQANPAQLEEEEHVQGLRLAADHLTFVRVSVRVPGLGETETDPGHRGAGLCYACRRWNSGHLCLLRWRAVWGSRSSRTCELRVYPFCTDIYSPSIHNEMSD